MWRSNRSRIASSVRVVAIGAGDRRREPACGQGELMAMIIEFRSNAMRGDARDTAETTGAEIIIFPGVRRERPAEDAKPRRREKGRPKRDRLELPD
jgi:hypothetical protein